MSTREVASFRVSFLIVSIVALAGVSVALGVAGYKADQKSGETTADLAISWITGSSERDQTRMPTGKRP